MHDIVKLVDGLMTCTREGKKNSLHICHWAHKGPLLYGTCSRWHLLKITKNGCGNYFLTFEHLLRVQPALSVMVISDDWDDLNIDRDCSNAVKKIVHDKHFWSQAWCVLQFSKPIYNMIQFVDSDKLTTGKLYEQRDSMLWKIRTMWRFTQQAWWCREEKLDKWE